MRGLESEQRRIRLRRGALTLLLGMLLRTFDFRGKAAGSLRKKCRLYGEGLSPRFVERSGGDIPLSRPLPPSQSPYISSGLSRDPIRSRRGRGETVMGKDDVCE